jgi:small subunit ribosomal protein S9
MAEARKKVKKKAPVRKKKEVKPVEAIVPAVEAKVAAPPPPPPAPVRANPTIVGKPKAPKITGPRYFGTGRRKEATAKVWMTPGSGKIMVNDRPLSQYFCGRKVLEYYATRPMAVAQLEGKYDVFAEAFGGGIPGQAAAVGLGMARALVQLNPALKSALKQQGLLTRDPRMKERKKYGLKRARRAFQYTKR